MSEAKQMIIGGVPIILKDNTARMSIGDLSDLLTTEKDNLVAAINEIALAGVQEYDVEIVSTLPTASESTMGNIYFVGPDASDNYNRYITKESEGAYSWLPLGSTRIYLSDYAKKDELSQLEAEVHNLSGKYYGLFLSSADLPEGDTPGYAFVGSEAPFAIWNFDGEEWSDTGASIDSVQGEPGVGFASVSTPTPADGTVVFTLSSGDTIILDLNHNHQQYGKIVADDTQPAGGFLPDVVYKLGTITGAVTFSLATAVTGNINHYFFTFDTGVSAPTITWPAGITWVGGSTPLISASKHYEVSILDGVAAIMEV